MVFVFEICNHFFNVINMVIKTVNIVHFFNRFSRSIFFNNGADGYNLSHFCSVYITINYSYMCNYS